MITRFLLLLTLLAGSCPALDKPSFGLDFATGGDYEHNSDTALGRRPATDYRGALNGSVSWWLLSAGLNLRYSTDDKFTAQRVNDFSFTPAWNWGRVYVGDFSTSFSEFTLSGSRTTAAASSFFRVRSASASWRASPVGPRMIRWTGPMIGTSSA